MTSQIRSHIEYLIQTSNIFVLILYSTLMKNVASLTLKYDLIMILDSGFNYFFWPPCMLFKAYINGKF